MAILSASASTISASIAFFSLRGIRREKKKEALKELEVKKQHLLSLYDDLKYIKATMNSIAKGEENNPSNAIELTVQKMYNIKFLTITEYGSYFDSRTSSALRAIRTAIVEHYSKFWYKNETDLFSSESYNDKDERKEVIKDAKKRVEIIDNRIKILKRLLKIYNQEIRSLNKKWSVEILRFFK